MVSIAPWPKTLNDFSSICYRREKAVACQHILQLIFKVKLCVCCSFTDHHTDIKSVSHKSINANLETWMNKRWYLSLILTAATVMVTSRLRGVTRINFTVIVVIIKELHAAFLHLRASPSLSVWSVQGSCVRPACSPSSAPSCWCWEACVSGLDASTATRTTSCSVPASCSWLQVGRDWRTHTQPVASVLGLKQTVSPWCLCLVLTLSSSNICCISTTHVPLPSVGFCCFHKSAL